MGPTNADDQAIFEDEVRFVARNLWPESQYSGARMIGGRERDGVFETDESIHLVEATTSRSKEKAKKDIGKLVGLANDLLRRSSHKAVQCWFVTKEEPTGEQREVAVKHRGLVHAVSFRQFQSRVIDAASYIQARDSYRFGSVRDPGTGQTTPKTGYVPLDLLDVQSGDVWGTDRIAGHLDDGGRLVLLGDFGAGKSMTLREAFRCLRAKHFRGQTYRFPVYLNLRDHFGQRDPVEVLERHARLIGFPSPSHLVRAWRAGYATLLIDGFDEVAALAILGEWRKLKDNRFRAMEAVRAFVRDTPRSAGVALAGRAHFFDSQSERKGALGLDPSFLELTLNDFTEPQVKDYLTRCGSAGFVPPWMPTRPLLLGYLLSRGLLGGQGAKGGLELGELDPAVGWDHLLTAIAQREAEIEAGIDGATVRRILERIATKARLSLDGMGPVTTDDIIESFKEVCGYAPEDEAMAILQRLPGLGVEPESSGSRRFVDVDFADACRGGDVAAFVNAPFSFEQPFLVDAECSLDTLGVCVAAEQLRRHTPGHGKLMAALKRAQEWPDANMLRSDLVRVAMAMGEPVREHVRIRGVMIPDMEIGEADGDMSMLEFENCYFRQLDIAPEVKPANVPRFHSCFIAELEGRISTADLPKDAFDSSCTFESFADSADTTSGILDLQHPLGVRVLLTVLKKLYVQRGKGRLESAFNRGLDQRGRRLVPDVLRLLQSEKLATLYRRGGLHIWLPDRPQMARIGRMLASPSMCRDPLLQRAADLG